MLKNVQMTLLIGPGVPVPAPRLVIEALSSVQITSGGERTGFQLKFAVSKTSKLQTTMIPAGYFDPGITRVIIAVTLGGIPTVLADGIVTRQEVAPSNDSSHSTITITGEDLSVLMDVVEAPFMRFPAMTVVTIIYATLAKYAVFGIAPIAIPPLFEDPTKANPTQAIPTQNGTDLAYIKQLAAQAGYVFYIEPGPVIGTNIAYFGPDIRIPIPQKTLSINMDAHSNVETLTFTLDGLKKKILVLNVLDPVTKKINIPVPVPNISILRPPLGARPTVPMKVEFSREQTKMSIPAAIGAALGRVAASSDAVTATGSLNVLRYGAVLKARGLVGVRGAGLTYDGMYYVNTVTHSIKRGEYKQNFTLSRDGLISQTPAVPV
jgi:hypothetical protein